MTKPLLAAALVWALVPAHAASPLFAPPCAAELPGGGAYRRSVAIEEFSYRADGTVPFIREAKTGPKANPAPGCNR